MAVRIEIVDKGRNFARFSARMTEVASNGPGGFGKLSIGAFVGAIKHLQREVASSALRTLPRSGGWRQSPQQGLAHRVARSRYRTGRARRTVLFQATNPYNIKSMDEGVVRHPVFGRADIPWVSQSVKADWFTRPTQQQGPRVRKALLKVMDLVKHRLTRL